MRKKLSILILLLIFIVIGSSTVIAQQKNSTAATPYTDELTEAVAIFNQLNLHNNYELCYSAFEKLAKKNTKDWLAPYYASLVKSKMSLMGAGDRDKLADEALYWVTNAKNIQVNDEVLCAESLAYTSKMAIRPITRYLQYESKIKAPLALAKKTNPNNPRVYLLEANIQMQIPSILGGGCKTLKSYVDNAEKLYALNSARSAYMPSWGRASLEQLKAACKF